MTVAACIAGAVLVIGAIAALAIVRIGSAISPGSRRSIERRYRQQRADLRAVLPDRIKKGI